MEGTFAAVALGANLGDREAAFAAALAGLDALPGTRVAAVSAWRETDPVGGVAGQPPYLNAVCVIRTKLAPRALLRAMQALERAAGRDRNAERAQHGRWGPRALDLDLIYFGAEVIDGPGIGVPHPSYRERGFVLEFLAEVAGEMRDPETGKTAAEHRAEWRARTTERGLIPPEPATPSAGN